MKLPLVLALGVAAVLALGGCRDGGDGKTEYFQGEALIGLTDNVPADGRFVLQNIYHPRVREVIAVVQIENAKVGTEVIGRWYQMGTIQQRAQGLTPEGVLISEAGFKITNDAINQDTKRGGGRLRLVPNAPLPEDSYELRVYIDGKLARSSPFVVSTIVPAPGATQPTPAVAPTPTPVR